MLCADSRFDRPQYGQSPGLFRQPWGAAAFGDNLIVSELSGKQLQVFTLAGEAVGQIKPSTGGALAGIWAGLAGADSGDGKDVTVLVADVDHHCVREVRLQRWY